MKSESPLFLKSYETMVWLLNHTKKFPKQQRFVLAQRMEQTAMDFHDALLVATRLSAERQKRSVLHRADTHLARLKVYNRLAKDLKLHSLKQYMYLAERLEEQGRLLGGWIKGLSNHRGTVSLAESGTPA